VLARLALEVRADAEPVDALARRAPPGRDLARTDLAPGRVEELDPLARRRGRPAQRLCRRRHLARDLRSPRREVLGDLDLDRGRLDPADLADQLGEAPRPAAGLAPEDDLERLALRVVGSSSR
jgi:hypothetical protein